MTEIAKVIKGLERCCVDNCTEGSKCPYYSEKDCLTTLLYDALEQLKDAETQLQYSDEVIYEEEKETARLRKLLKEQEAQGWISVEDRLPDKKGRYLCACIDYDTNTYWIDILWHVSGQWWRRLSTRGTDKDYNDHVRYWMSLPSTKGLDT